MVEIKTGPKEIVDETSNVTYRLYDAQFFSNIDEAGIDYSEDDLALEFLGPEEAGFILMKMDVENIDNPGDDYGTINAGTIFVEPRDYDEETDWDWKCTKLFCAASGRQKFLWIIGRTGRNKDLYDRIFCRYYGCVKEG